MTKKLIARRWWPEEKWLQALHLGLWLLFFCVHWAAFSEMMPIGLGLARSVVNIGLLMILFYGCGQAFLSFYERRRFAVYIVVILVLFILITLLRFSFNVALPVEYPERPYFQPGPASFLFGVIFTNIICVLSSPMYESLLAKSRMEQLQAQFITEQREAKIQFLQAQLNPHFLFNTLNNIYSLAIMKSEKTAPLVLRLSDLLQYVVCKGQQGMVGLQEELDLLQEYLDMFQLQYEHQLEIRFSQQSDREDYRLPPLLLLPVIENCFKHGDFAENEDAYLTIDLQAKEEVLSFVVRNTYNAQQQQKDRVGGVGLENIKRRLELYSPTNNRLQTHADGTVFTVEMTMGVMRAFKIGGHKED